MGWIDAFAVLKSRSVVTQCNFLQIRARWFSQSYPVSQSKKIDQMPGPKPSLPFIGTNWIYSKFGKYNLSQLHLANLDKYFRYGQIVREEFQPGHPVVHLFEPNDFANVLRSQGPAPLRPPNEFVCHYRSRHPQRYPNAGIANLQGEQWAEQRRLLAPALLKLGALDAYLPQLNQLAQELVQCILRKKNDNSAGVNNLSSIDILDLQSLTYRLALEAICALCLDTRLHCLDADQITPDGRILVEATWKLFDAYQQLYYAPPLWKLYDTPAFKQLASAESSIYETAGKYIGSAMAKLNFSLENESNFDHQEDRPSLMRTLLSIPNLDKRDIRTLILDFIAGGINTTSNMLAVALWHLASNPSKQQALYDELSLLFPEHRQSGFKIDVDSNRLNKSKYLRACLKESFRLDSPIPCIVRTLTSDLELCGYHVTAGTTVFLHIFTACRLEKNFANPLQFVPERWLNESRKQIHPFASLPFGYGPRMCAGRRFSEMQLQVAMIQLILRFHLKPISKELKMEQRFILVPAHPIAIQFIRR